MRNLKTYRLYGMSPLEQAITMAMTGDMRLEFQKNLLHRWLDSGRHANRSHNDQFGENSKRRKAF